MTHATETPPTRTKKPSRFGLTADGTSSPLGLLVKIVGLALVAAVAVWAAMPLIDAENWLGLAILLLVTVVAFYVYLSPRPVPMKYLLPGHPVPDRLPDRAGDLHDHHGVHELQRRAPRRQGPGDRRHRGRLGEAGPGLDDLHAHPGHRR